MIKQIFSNFFLYDQVINKTLTLTLTQSFSLFIRSTGTLNINLKTKGNLKVWSHGKMPPQGKRSIMRKRTGSRHSILLTKFYDVCNYHPAGSRWFSH